MKEFWIPFLVSISTLALGGVSYLAFAEPPIYGALFILLISMLGLGFWVWLIWSTAVTFSWIAARQAITEFKAKEPDKVPFELSWAPSEAVEEKLKKTEMPWWAMLVALLLAAYLMGLRAVPILRETLEKNSTAPHQEQHQQAKPKIP